MDGESLGLAVAVAVCYDLMMGHRPYSVGYAKITTVKLSAISIMTKVDIDYPHEMKPTTARNIDKYHIQTHLLCRPTARSDHLWHKKQSATTCTFFCYFRCQLVVAMFIRCIVGKRI